MDGAPCMCLLAICTSFVKCLLKGFSFSLLIDLREFFMYSGFRSFLNVYIENVFNHSGLPFYYVNGEIFTFCEVRLMRFNFMTSVSVFHPRYLPTPSS